MSRRVGKILICFLITLSHYSYAQQITENKDEANALYTEAIHFYEGASYHDAFHAFSEAIKDKSWLNKKSKEEQAQIYYKIAFSLYQEENYGEAILWFDQVLHLSKLLDQETYLYRGICLYEIGKIDAALADLRKSAPLKTNAALTKVARDYLTRIEVQNFKKPLFVNTLLPENKKNIYTRGLSNLRKGQYKEAEQDILKYSKMDDDNYQVYHALGTLYVKTKNYNKGIEFFKKAIELVPEDLKVYYENSFGAVYFFAGKDALNQKQFDQASVYFTKAIETESWFENLPNEMKAQALYNIAFSYFELKNLKSAKVYFNEILSIESSLEQTAYFYLGQIDMQSGKKGGAISHFRKATSIDTKTKLAQQSTAYSQNLAKDKGFSATFTNNAQYDSNVKTQTSKNVNPPGSAANTEQVEIKYQDQEFWFDNLAFETSYSVHHKYHLRRTAVKTSDSLRHSANMKFTDPFYWGKQVYTYKPSLDIAHSLTNAKGFKTQNKSIGTTQALSTEFLPFWNPQFSYTISYTDQSGESSTITEDIRDAFTNKFNFKNEMHIHSFPYLSSISLSAEVAYNRADNTYTYWEYGPKLDVSGALMWGISYNSSVEVGLSDYRDNRQGRRDFKYEEVIGLSKSIFGLSSSLNYTDTYVNSNLPDFTYKRFLLSFSLSYTL